MAARALGIIANPRGIVPLVYALLDDAAEVRRAAEQALAQISGPVVANLGGLLEEELNLTPTKWSKSFSAHKNAASEETPISEPH